MCPPPLPEPPDLTLLLPRSTYWQFVHKLQSNVPPAVDDTREARIAVRSVLAEAQAAASLLQARKYQDDIAIFPKVQRSTVHQYFRKHLLAASQSKNLSADAGRRCTQSTQIRVS